MYYYICTYTYMYICTIQMYCMYVCMYVALALSYVLSYQRHNVCDFVCHKHWVT